MTTPKIETLKANMTVLYTDDYTILYSYNTPVACMELETGKYYRTTLNHSVTTSKHINQWLHGKVAESIDQHFFSDLSC